MRNESFYAKDTAKGCSLILISDVISCHVYLLVRDWISKSALLLYLESRLAIPGQPKQDKKNLVRPGFCESYALAKTKLEVLDF